MDLNDYKEKKDEEIIEMVLKDQEHFLIIMKRYKEKLYRYISRISNFDEQQKEDILQEIFISTYVNINSFDTSLKFSSWIYRIAHNHVINKFRKTQRRPKIYTIDSEDSCKLKSDLDLGKQIDLKFFYKDIIKILNELDDKYREVLILRFLEEKNYKEISDILKISQGTVATLISRGKKQFKEKFKKYE